MLSRENESLFYVNLAFCIQTAGVTKHSLEVEDVIMYRESIEPSPASKGAELNIYFFVALQNHKSTTLRTSHSLIDGKRVQYLHGDTQKIVPIRGLLVSAFILSDDVFVNFRKKKVNLNIRKN